MNDTGPIDLETIRCERHLDEHACAAMTIRIAPDGENGIVWGAVSHLFEDTDPEWADRNLAHAMEIKAAQLRARWADVATPPSPGDDVSERGEERA